MNALLVWPALAAVGSGVMGWGLFLILRGLATRGWPSTTGQIVESGFRDYHEPGNYGYTYHIKYMYSVKGAARLSSQIQFGLNSYLNKNVVDEFIKRYPVGGDVTVFYHPTKQYSVLVRGFTPQTYFLILVGLFLITISIVKMFGNVF